MKKIPSILVRGLIVGAAFLGSASLWADPAVMAGVTLNTNGEVGFSVSVLSSDEENDTVASVGLSLFPSSSDPIGLNVGAGQNFDNTSVVVSWDVIHSVPLLSVGYIDTAN